MRVLNQKQKDAITKLYNDGYSWGSIQTNELNRIESMNEHETFYQNATRFFFDLECNEMAKKRERFYSFR